MAAVRAADPSTTCSVAAIEEPGALRAYKSDVRWRIHQGDPESYREAAKSINLSNAEVVSIEHEFGLYGLWNGSRFVDGNWTIPTYDDHLIGFLQEIALPVVTTMHTVLPHPTPTIRKTVRAISEMSDELIVMAQTAADILARDYGIVTPPRVIPHGMPTIEPRGRATFKAKMGVKDRSIISTFGLVDPRKGLEFMIQAMPAIVKQNPDALYIIAGQTHPDLLRSQGEDYRNLLIALTTSLGMTDHVAFIDEYMSQSDIISLLLATDIYVTPYLDPNQITSGTLSWALGAGKAVVSTEYLHAKEALADDRGILVGFRDAPALAEAVNRIAADPALKRNYEQAAFAYGLHSTWPRAGQAFLDVLKDTVNRTQSRTAVGGGGIWLRSSDLGHRLANNPILTAADVKPSRPTMEVVSVFNAAAAKIDDEVILLLRVGERPRVGLSPPPNALTLDFSTEEPSVVPLVGEYTGDNLVSIAYLDMHLDPPSVVDVFLPRDLTGLDLSDPRAVRYHHPDGGFNLPSDDFTDFLTQMSHLRIARSKDGANFVVDELPTVSPENRFEEYGCEDPRATLIDGVWYITYVSVGHIGITTSLLTTTDFRTFERHGLMFLPDHKDVVILPGKYNGRYAALTRPMPQSFGRIIGIWIAFSPDLVHWGDHQPLALPRPGMWDELRLGASAVPFVVDGGILEIYHGVNRDTHYSLGGLLLDANDPSIVLARSPEPILVPIEPYERDGLFSNTIFSCGHVALDDTGPYIRVYYGAADICMAAADVKVQDILDQMIPC